MSVEAVLLRARKAEIVDSLRGAFGGAGVVVVAHYKGLSVAEVGELRRGMREVGAVFRVTKNTLARIAVEDTQYASLDGLFTGPTAIAYSADPVAAPKAAVGFARRALASSASSGRRVDSGSGAAACGTRSAQATICFS